MGWREAYAVPRGYTLSLNDPAILPRGCVAAPESRERFPARSVLSTLA